MVGEDAQGKFRLSRVSKARLGTCHPLLVDLVEEALATSPLDFTVLCGYRGKDEQDLAVAQGNSKVKWPNSKHNSLPSRAVDLAPYPVDWDDLGRFRQLATHVMMTAQRMEIGLRWGGNFRFVDMPHFELQDIH